jgi:adenylate cyclase
MQRKLIAILFADVVGWNRLSQTDEAGALERLKCHRNKILDPLMAEHGGRIVKLLGDGTLAEFSNIVAAVTCSLSIQDAVARAEPELHNDLRIRFRIGVNLGDVMIDGDDIYGEGVNVLLGCRPWPPREACAFQRRCTITSSAGWPARSRIWASM